MYSTIYEYGLTNPEKFNEDLIYLKTKDDVLKHIESIFDALKVINGVEFLGCSLNSDESTFPAYVKGDKNIVNINESRLVLINFKFKLTDPKTGEEDIVEKYLFFPKLIDKTYFILNGNKYFPIYQIIDSATYNTSTGLILKTLFMRVNIGLKHIDKFFDVLDNEYTGQIKYIDLFKNKLNYLIYFFVDRGFAKTMEYFIGSDWEEHIALLTGDELDIESNMNDWNIFCVSNKDEECYLLLSKELMNRDKETYSFCLNLIDILMDTQLYQVYDLEYWTLRMGKIFSRNKNKSESKANDIMISFKRILDNSTKSTLRLKEENKKDIFAIIRWMVQNYDTLKNRDNMDLENKRIRIYEYLCYDLLIKMSNATYRLLNKSEIKLKDRQQLFSTLSPMFMIKKINSNELLRYYGGVNSLELFNPSLKFSMRGFQGLGEGNKNVSKSYRGLHESYPGRICLTSASNSDPGLTGTFSPFMENFGFYFSDKMLDE